VRIVPRPFILPLSLLLTFLFSTPSASGWGCKGHQIVALIAENHLNSPARTIALQILAASPIDPKLPSYCGATTDPLADASTWADDVRQARPDTASWHFIDIPRGAPEKDVAKYCPPDTGCVVTALADQLRILRDAASSPRARADALRFVIHFVGDIHQPLHTDTNNDLGGNCVPVSFLGRTPAASGPDRGVFIPNLHEVWDVEIIERLTGGESPRQVAEELERKFSAKAPAWESQPTDFSAWAWESHALAESTAYGRLPRRIAIQVPRPTTSCADDPIRVGMPQLDESLGDDYQNAAAPVVQEQLAKAGTRLAALLNSLLP